MTAKIDIQKALIGLVIVPVSLLLLLSIARADELVWSEYVRLLTVLIALGICRWMYRSLFAPILWSTVLILVVALLCASVPESIEIHFLIV